MSLKRDQKFFDLYSLTIGILALFGLAIFVLAMKMSDLTQGFYKTQTDEYQEQVASRLSPMGRTYMPGEEGTDDNPRVSQVAASEPVEAALSGPQVYNEACIACRWMPSSISVVPSPYSKYPPSVTTIRIISSPGFTSLEMRSSMISNGA